MDPTAMNRATASQRPTTGLLLDVALARANSKFMAELRRWASYVDTAAQCGFQFVVVAGASRDDEAITMFAKDAAIALASLPVAHARMAEIGSGATVWIIHADAALKQQATQLLASLAITEGNA